MNITVQQPLNNSEPQLQFSTAAIQHIKRHLKKHTAYASVRFATKVAGCSGMQYVVNFIDNPADTDTMLAIDSELTVYVDKKSIPFIQGSFVDYVWDAEKLGHTWKFTNPNAGASCGCGESFTIQKEDE
jgi:iron-sulfur cluster assembly protein